MLKYLVFLSTLLLITAGCKDENQQISTEETQQTADPAEYIVKIDSMGVELGDSSQVFGAVEGAVTGPDGNIAVLDRAACCIRVFSPEGEFLRQISRKGNGPGEMISTAFLTITEDGTLIVAGDGSETLGIHAFDYLTGQWIGSDPCFSSPPPTCLEGASGRTYMRKFLDVDTSTGEPQVVVQITLNEVGVEEPLVVFHEDRMPFEQDNISDLISLIWFGYDLACDFSGRFYVSPRSTEEAIVYAYDSTGEELFTIELDTEPMQRTEEELETEMLILTARAMAMDAAELVPSLEASEFKPQIRGLEVDSAGNLWVLLGGPPQPTFQVFNYLGEYQHRVVLHGDQPDGHSWNFNFSNFSNSILAYAEDPADGFQKVWTLEVE